MHLTDKKIAVIGLGYVGLPLAVEFGQKFKTIGFDINKIRISQLKQGKDVTLEISDDYLLSSITNGLFSVSTDLKDIQDCDVYIVTVPTPTDRYNRPVLTPLIKASESVGSVLSKGNIVIYESTVYPGVTEDECVPVLERISGLKYNHDFFAGYSPERINPGDKEHTVTKILKVTSGSTPEIAEVIDQIYKSIIVAGTYKASNIRVAEAAKVIENSQRDINIAFVNELSKIFNLLGIDTNEVLDAAATKWNFLKFKPGLVGGHCIGVDPYYLAQKAQEVGYHPEIILAGRRLNDGMGAYVANETIKLMLKKDIKIKNARVLVLGFTFKEDCPDVRNTKVIDIIHELNTYDLNLTLVDPWADELEIKREYGIDSTKEIPANQKFDAIVLAVGHKQFLKLDYLTFLEDIHVIFDVKGLLSKDIVDMRL
ncbi:Vi polysaccharide biosynthesis protein VipA/TviB [Aquirufa nivalisilvae]|uniref:Vi polysaccharide biosynthesis protein VipA/TviB n=1 Tax=Aquirufa nivalisilvae TaxID=2516557 RepID=A0A2S2DYH3_9BACT|nr:Vi polysaccharide biosynthesis protein VipA/TviB [Aquirufa nivalisilvae]